MNLRGRLFRASRPQVMAILNVTDDSFYDASRAMSADDIARRAENLIASGADIIDVGACSTRPGAVPVDLDTETARIVSAVGAIRSVDPDIPVSVDTFRAPVARRAVEAGADIINDISGGDLDPEMFDTVASLPGVPYILMHMRGTPATMQSLTQYDDVVADVIADLSAKLNRLSLLGVADVIIDPGLGFAKTLDQNYALLGSTGLIADTLGCPVLIGASRKSMLTRALGITAAEALNATTVVNTIALERGASILRVHDPLEARQAVNIVQLLFNND